MVGYLESLSQVLEGARKELDNTPQGRGTELPLEGFSLRQIIGDCGRTLRAARDLLIRHKHYVTATGVVDNIAWNLVVGGRYFRVLAAPVWRFISGVESCALHQPKRVWITCTTTQINLATPPFTICFHGRH